MAIITVAIIHMAIMLWLLLHRGYYAVAIMAHEAFGSRDPDTRLLVLSPTGWNCA